MTRQGFKSGDYIDLGGGDGCGVAGGNAVWRRGWSPPGAPPGEGGFLGPCGRFFTPKRLGHLVELAHEDAADTPHPPRFAEDFVCMAEALIAEGLLRPGPVHGAKVWREV